MVSHPMNQTLKKSFVDPLGKSSSIFPFARTEKEPQTAVPRIGFGRRDRIDSKSYHPRAQPNALLNKSRDGGGSRSRKREKIIEEEPERR